VLQWLLGCGDAPFAFCGVAGVNYATARLNLRALSARFAFLVDARVFRADFAAPPRAPRILAARRMMADSSWGEILIGMVFL